MYRQFSSTEKEHFKRTRTLVIKCPGFIVETDWQDVTDLSEATKQEQVMFQFRKKK